MATNNSNNTPNVKTAYILDTGTNALNISTDASATTVNIGTGAAAKTVSLGSTNTTSTTTMSSGSGNIIYNSGLTVDSTGRKLSTVQPAFYAYLSSSPTNVTGNGTSYTLAFNSTSFDQNSNFNTTTHTFTAPVTGKYQFNLTVSYANLVAAFTGGVHNLVTTAVTYTMCFFTPTNTNHTLTFSGSALVAMTSGDTATVTALVAGSTKTVGITGGLGNSSFSGFLVC